MPIQPRILAFVSAGLSDYNRAIAWLEQAAEERGGWLVILKTWPPFDPLRSDARFQALFKRMNFPAPPQS